MIKNELVRGRSYATKDQALLALFDYVDRFSNPPQRHSACIRRSPDAYERIYHQAHDRERIVAT